MSTVGLAGGPDGLSGVGRDTEPLGSGESTTSSSSDSNSISESESSPDSTRTADGERDKGYSSSIGSDNGTHVTSKAVLSPSCRMGSKRANWRPCRRSPVAGSTGRFDDSSGRVTGEGSVGPDRDGGEEDALAPGRIG